jgi:hypothetical protein
MKRTKPKPKCAPTLTLDAETFARMLQAWRENGWQHVPIQTNSSEVAA